ncbi:Hypothetical protein Minf_0957 [Methylacidiphilum infernorum V4]|uniref:Uncharacterized protein n=1 Tax=Methylacidiphilum infernorum (isolate V4) TaxID=481448 RepID=B3DUK9_METI4|nr:Hypothetical protein Minf_0957 [Methylacidiphilum infernorum V4]
MILIIHDEHHSHPGTVGIKPVSGKAIGHAWW